MILKLIPKVSVAWAEFAAASGIDPSNLELKRAFYAGVKWMDRCAGNCHTLNDDELIKLALAVKAELAEFSGQNLRQYLARE